MLFAVYRLAQPVKTRAKGAKSLMPPILLCMNGSGTQPDHGAFAARAAEKWNFFTMYFLIL